MLPASYDMRIGRFANLSIITIKSVDYPDEIGYFGTRKICRSGYDVGGYQLRVYSSGMLVLSARQREEQMWRDCMLNISKEAVQQLVEYRNRRGPEALVRIGILSGSTSGPSLGVSIDEKNDDDQVFSFDGVEVVINSKLMSYCEEISVEYVLQKGGGCASGGGFRLVPKNRI